MAHRTADYVDVLEAALVDGYLATFECAQLEKIGTELGLTPDEVAHVHLGYYVALAVEAWADGEITWEERMQLTLIARALGIPDDQAIEWAQRAIDIEPPVDLPGLGLTTRDRIGFAEPIDTAVIDWHTRVEQIGLLPTADFATARYVVTSTPGHPAHQLLWEAGVMVISEWSFVIAVEHMEARRARRLKVLEP